MHALTKYLIKRIIAAVIVAVGIIAVTFSMLHLMPGDPAVVAAGEGASPETIERVRKELRLNEPIYVQFYTYLTNVLQGNFGRSIVSGRPVIDELMPRFINTLQLALISIIIATTVGIAFGIFAAIKHGSILDTMSTIISMIGVCTPSFFLGILLMYIFSVQLGWFPTLGKTGLESFVLPAITLSTWSLATIMRTTRTSMIEVLNQDYIRTARAMGLGERTVIFKHALRNAMIPIITITGVRFGLMLAAAVYVETVFSWPGIGRFIVESISRRDFPSIQGGILLLGVSFVILNLAVDLLCQFIDPRVRYEREVKVGEL
jgi:ABC-type dipeptide/oligopeptide/nickel transport system permease component